MWNRYDYTENIKKKIEDIKKIVKYPEESGLIIKVVSEAIENKTKEQKGRLLGMLIGTLAASFLENMITDKAKIPRWGVIRVGEGTKLVRIFNGNSSFN